MLITARAIQGIGGAGLLTLVDIAISDLFSLRTRGAYLGIIGAVWAIACAIGPVLGGALTSRVSWRWCFWINLPLDAIAFVVILFTLKLKTPKVPLVDGLKAIDWLGTLLIIGGTVMFLMGLQYGGITFPWASATVLSLLIVGPLLAAAFALVEWKIAKYPLIPLSIFQDRSAAGCLLFTFLHGIVYIAVFYFLPLYFQVRSSLTRQASQVVTHFPDCQRRFATSFWRIRTTQYHRHRTHCSRHRRIHWRHWKVPSANLRWRPHDNPWIRPVH